MHTFNRFFGLPAIFYSLFNPHTRDIFAYRKKKNWELLLIKQTHFYAAMDSFNHLLQQAYTFMCVRLIPMHFLQKKSKKLLWKFEAIVLCFCVWWQMMKANILLLLLLLWDGSQLRYLIYELYITWTWSIYWQTHWDCDAKR